MCCVYLCCQLSHRKHTPQHTHPAVHLVRHQKEDVGAAFGGGHHSGGGEACGGKLEEQ